MKEIFALIKAQVRGGILLAKQVLQNRIDLILLAAAVILSILDLCGLHFRATAGVLTGYLFVVLIRLAIHSGVKKSD